MFTKRRLPHAAFLYQLVIFFLAASILELSLSLSLTLLDSFTVVYIRLPIIYAMLLTVF